MGILDLSNLLGTSAPDLRATLVSILVAFLVSHALAVVYVWSARGLSYSHSFVQALVMGAVAASIMMMVIGNNLVWGVGLVGALALVRFRTNLHDPRDMIFVFASLVLGIASGTGAYALATLGCLLFCAVALYLSKVSFGLRGYFDALLRFTLAGGNKQSSDAMQERLNAHCSRFVLAMMQEVGQGEAIEHVYQVRFRRDDSRQQLVGDLERVPGLTNISLMLEEARVEI